MKLMKFGTDLDRTLSAWHGDLAGDELIDCAHDGDAWDWRACEQFTKAHFSAFGRDIYIVGHPLREPRAVDLAIVTAWPDAGGTIEVNAPEAPLLYPDAFALAALRVSKDPGMLEMSTHGVSATRPRQRPSTSMAAMIELIERLPRVPGLTWAQAACVLGLDLRGMTEMLDGAQITADTVAAFMLSGLGNEAADTAPGMITPRWVARYIISVARDASDQAMTGQERSGIHDLAAYLLRVGGSQKAALYRLLGSREPIPPAAELSSHLGLAQFEDALMDGAQS